MLVFACVWAPESDREAIFRSLQARRTFGATDKIRLIFKSGDHWMGERFEARVLPDFQFEIDAKAPIDYVDFYYDGDPVRRFKAARGERSFRASYRPRAGSPGEHYFYIHMVQADANQAWSSPIWVTLAGEETTDGVSLKERAGQTQGDEK